MVGRGHSSILLFWLGIWVFDCLRIVQYPKEQLRAGRYPGVDLQCRHGNIRQRGYFCDSRFQGSKQCGEVQSRVSFTYGNEFHYLKSLRYSNMEYLLQNNYITQSDFSKITDDMYNAAIQSVYNKSALLECSEENELNAVSCFSYLIT